MEIKPGDYGIFKLHADGTVEAFGLRVVFFRIETRASIRASLLDLLGRDGGAIVLGLVGERIGRDSGTFAKNNLGLVLNDKALNKFANIYLQSGRGKRVFEIKDGYAIVRIYNSFEADAHLIALGKSDKPECHFVRGYLKGLFSALSGSNNVEVEETKCKAKGDDHCEFVVRF